MKLTAKMRLTACLEPITGTSQRGNWSKATWIFTTGSDTLPITVWDHEPINPGEYMVEMEIGGREYNGKYYTDIKLDGIMPVEAQTPTRQSSKEFIQSPPAQQADMFPPSAKQRAMERNQYTEAQVQDLPF